mmetsp:Transcript_34961/g.48478  ORF Transcript_34961/g.48478 Transcript_34961/m.48478 type:complete len:247 (+) Transcript_34961:3-743(+)
MIPAIDFLNHHATDFQVEWQLDVPGDCVSLMAVAAISVGEQVFATYGDRSNDDFYLFYGFVPSRNMSDDVELFATSAEAVEWYSALILEEQMPALSLDDKSLSNHNLEIACVGALKAAEDEQSCMEAKEREVELQEGGWLHGKRASETTLRALRGGMVDERLMALLEHFHISGVGLLSPLKAIQRRCTELLNNFDTSAEADAEALSEGGEDMTNSTALIMRYRLAKKVVIMTLIEICEGEIQEDIL